MKEGGGLWERRGGGGGIRRDDCTTKVHETCVHIPTAILRWKKKGVFIQSNARGTGCFGDA